MELLHRWSAVVWPQDATAALLLLAACAVLIAGLRRRGLGFGRFAPSLLLVVVCELWVLLADLRHEPLSASWPLGAVAFILLVIQLVAGWDAQPGSEVASGRASGRGYLVAGSVVACLLLGGRLASSPGQLLVWEPTVIEGFGESLRAGRDAAAFLGATVLWDNGLVSRGDHSLLYGAPSYAVFLGTGFGIWQLRIVAALLAAASVPVVFALARRFGGGIATAAALVLALSPPLLFYGRYGTSLSGTLLGVLLATWACWAFVSGPAWQWWRGPLAALALIVATLGYSPGRLVVLALLVVTAAFTAARLPKEGLRRLSGLALLVAVLAGFWLLQAHWGTAWYFLNARGEQIVNIVTQPGYVEEFLHRPAPDGPQTLETWIDVTRTLVAQRAPEYLSVLGAPFGRQIGFNEVVYWDPPKLPLFIAPLLPFLLLGLASSVRRAGQPEHSTLLAWLLLGSVPLLLTTRIDAHRMMLLVVPFALWTAFGLAGMVAALNDARIGKWPRHALGVMLIGLVGWLDVVAIFPVKERSSTLAPAMIAELHGLRGEILLASIADQSAIGIVDLVLLERQRRDPGSPSRLLADEQVRALADGANVDHQRIADLVAQVGTGTLLMVPAEAFRGTAGALRDAGLEVVELGPRGARFWRAARSDASPGA